MMKRWLPFAVGIGIVVWVVALALLAVTAEGSQRYSDLSAWILLINILGVVVLLVLIGGRLYDFIRDWRRHVPGSRLRGRTILMFGGLAIAPLLLVFTFSVLFQTRGIDSWFHAEIRQGLSDALGLSRAALDLRRQPGSGALPRSRVCAERDRPQRSRGQRPPGQGGDLR